MKYKDCCKEVGFDPVDYNPPSTIIKWFAYDKGKVIECANQAEAKKYRNHDFVVEEESQKVRDEYIKTYKELERKAIELFLDTLRDDYSQLSDAVYAKCYSKAYEAGHAYGYDEVANELSDIADFAADIIKAVKSEKS